MCQWKCVWFISAQLSEPDNENVQPQNVRPKNQKDTSVTEENNDISEGKVEGMSDQPLKSGNCCGSVFKSQFKNLDFNQDFNIKKIHLTTHR